MKILADNTYHPDVLARTYSVLFLDGDADAGWSNLVACRNAEYARYLTPSTTATGTAQWDWSIRTGQMADTIERLNEKWHQTIQDYISTAITAQVARMLKTKSNNEEGRADA